MPEKNRVHCTRMTPEDSPELIVVERIAPGGSGVGRLATGEIVFVEAAAPGDEVELSSIARRKGIAHASIHRLSKPGEARIEPTCPVAKQCGGCDFMHLSQAGQRQAKLEMLEDALRRVGDNPQGELPVGFVPSDADLGYRSRVRLHVNQDGRVGFLSARSRQLVVVSLCLVSTPLINAALAMLQRANDASRRLLSLCEQIELREAAVEPRLVVRLFPKPHVKLDARKFVPLFAEDTSVVLASQPDEARAIQRYALPNSVESYVPASAFTQVNQTVNQKLVSAVLQAVARHGITTFVDAYAGAGNFTLPLLACGLRGEAVDNHAAGIYCARSVARDRGWPHEGFQVGDARKLLESFVRAKRRFDLILLDPPREGSKNALDAALRLDPRLIILIACDPVALARDLKWLVTAGARVESLTVFDMFPQTHHFETLAAVVVQSR